jgi:hypothetical protein
MSNLRDRLRQGLDDKMEQSYNRRELSFKGIFKDQIPFPIWRCMAGEHQIDVIPYFAGPNHPLVKEGESTHCMEVWVHRNVGPTDGMAICLQNTFKPPVHKTKRCPICEHRSKLRQKSNYDEDVVKSLLPTRYVAYYIICYDSEKEEQKGLQIFYVSHWFMERHLSTLSKRPASKKGTVYGGYKSFADPSTEGSTISFIKEGKGKGNVSFMGHRLIQREYEIPDKILEQAATTPLDSLMEIPTYEEVLTLFLGEEETKTPESNEAPPEFFQPDPEDEDVFTEDQGPGIPSERPEPPKQESPKREAGSKECPGGGTFGKDIERLDKCGECPIWEPCSDESMRLAEERRKQRADLPRRDQPATSRRGQAKR